MIIENPSFLNFFLIISKFLSSEYIIHHLSFQVYHTNTSKLKKSYPQKRNPNLDLKHSHSLEILNHLDACHLDLHKDS